MPIFRTLLGNLLTADCFDGVWRLTLRNRTQFKATNIVYATEEEAFVGLLLNAKGLGGIR